MGIGHFNPGNIDQPGGCFTCRYGGEPLGDLSDPLAHHTIACRARTWPATFPHEGCSGWEREPGCDDEIHARP
jgi:hypothetical protein